MGSIAAVLGAKTRADAETVDRMLRSAPHRGAATHVVVRGACVLGISNHPDLGDAHLASSDELTCAFFGQLDNATELVREIQPGSGADPAPSPAQVVLELFKRFELDTPRRLRGAFSAVISDGRAMWCFRDQIGFKPLHHRRDATGVYVATEAKQVVAGAGVSSEPDVDVIEHIFYNDFDATLPSALKGVERVPKSRILVADGDRISIYRYWDPEPILESARLSGDEMRQRFEELMSQAAARTLDEATVVSLSGGIDSPGVAAFAAPVHLARTGRPLAALSEVYPQHSSTDERYYIELICRSLAMPLYTFEPGPRSLDRLAEWAHMADGPVPMWSPNDDHEYFVRANEQGFRTVLQGCLAESVIEQRSHLAGHLLWRGRWGALGRYELKRRANGAGLRAIGTELVVAAMPAPVKRTYVRSRKDRLQPWIPDWLDSSREASVIARQVAPARRRWVEAQLADFSAAPGLVLDAQEALHTSAGVRVRQPWADVDLWEFFLSLPAEVKFPERGRKVLAKSFLRGHLPDEVLDRTDRTVFNEWLMHKLDYPALRHWLIDPPYRLPGVRYDVLADHLSAEDLDFVGYQRAQDLAFVHAFLSRW